jgi:hypothetical protein
LNLILFLKWALMLAIKRDEAANPPAKGESLVSGYGFGLPPTP